MINIRGVSKRYGAVEAVRDVSFEIPRGQVVGLLGPNGAGKSTTIRMIATLLPPTTGRVSVDGMDTIDHSIGVRRRLGYLPESTPLYTEMPVIDYLRYRGALHGMGRSDRRRAADEAIVRCQLSEVRRRAIGTLSKGYRQRTGLAAALVHGPSVLLLDEPTSGLDPAQVVETRRLIRELAGDRTVILVSHLLPEVEKTCDRIIIMARGRVQADGKPSELVAADTQSGGARCVVDAMLDPQRLGQLVHGIPGVASVETSPAEGSWTRGIVTFDREVAGPTEALGRAFARSGVPVRELRRESESLEELYIRLIERAESSTDASRASGVAA